MRFENWEFATCDVRDRKLQTPIFFEAHVKQFVSDTIVGMHSFFRIDSWVVWHIFLAGCESISFLVRGSCARDNEKT